MSNTPELHLSASFEFVIESIHHDWIGPPLHHFPNAPINQDSDTTNPQLSTWASKPLLADRLDAPEGRTAAMVKIPKL